MKATFVSQPFSASDDMRKFIAACAADPSISRLDLVVAWAKRSGLNLVADDLNSIRNRGGEVRMIIGVSEGGATRQGLELTSILASTAYVFHVPGRTFHPKVFLATAPATARLLVGSQNMTAGGALTNYEAGVDMSLDRGDAADEALCSSVEQWIDQLIADTDVCRPLNGSLLAQLVADPRYRIGNEDTAHPGSKGSNADTDSFVDDTDGIIPPLFGKSKYSLKSLSSFPNRHSGDASTARGTRGMTATAIGHGRATSLSGDTSSPTVAKRWYKQLKPADAQQLGGTSNPSGHVTLVNAGHPIDKRTYFRRDFFAAEAWTPEGTKNEVCTIRAEVVVGAASLGMRSFTVQHTPAFEAGQGNRSTVLHWESLSPHMRSVSHVAEYITIERLSSGGYRLTLAHHPVGPFIK